MKYPRFFLWGFPTDPWHSFLGQEHSRNIATLTHRPLLPVFGTLWNIVQHRNTHLIDGHVDHLLARNPDPPHRWPHSKAIVLRMASGRSVHTIKSEDLAASLWLDEGVSGG